MAEYNDKRLHQLLEVLGSPKSAKPSYGSDDMNSDVRITLFPTQGGKTQIEVSVPYNGHPLLSEKLLCKTIQNIASVFRGKVQCCGEEFVEYA